MIRVAAEQAGPDDAGVADAVGVEDAADVEDVEHVEDVEDVEDVRDDDAGTDGTFAYAAPAVERLCEKASDR